VFACAGDIRILRLLVAAAEQQDYLTSGDCVVDSVSRPDIDPQFPYAIAAELVVSEIPQFDSIDAPVDGNLCLCVTELAAPLKKWVSLVRGKVVPDLVYDSVSSINELQAREFEERGRHVYDGSPKCSP
jgi:hypothetical protein